MKSPTKQTGGQGRTTEFPRLLGGVLCLHFANTIEGPRSDEPEEFLTSFDDLVRWGWHARLLERDEADTLLDSARSRPEAAREAFGRALELRGAIQRVFRAIARSETPPERDLDHVRREYAQALGAARLAETPRGYAWSWGHASRELDRPLWLVAESAARLLTEGDLGRVKECPGADDCGWLFYDASRNASRRWCSMEGCGSRVKMRRHYARRERVRR
jgi:predicted RNA-binding Zn ribbon-like protein